MENKNNIIDELKERWACYDQVRFLFEQPFERQREALLDIEGKVRAIWVATRKKYAIAA